MSSPAGTRRWLDALLAEQGFSSWGVARVEALELEHARLERWLASGRHGPLAYMAARARILEDPSQPTFLEGARSMVIASLAVTRPAPPPGSLAAMLARHARGRDYHEVMGRRLRGVLSLLRAQRRDLRGRVFVDTAPVMEKAWAQRAGLGWIGRNGLLVQRGRGSFSVLGGLALTVDVEPDEPARDGCGECTACIDACPVGAIGDDRLVDARRCLSCLTIERRGELDVQSAGRLEGRQVFGCDLCQLACPHNERPTEGPPELDPRPLLAALTPREYLQLDEPGAGWVLRGTALERTGARVLKENVRAALGDPISRDARW